MPRIRLFTAFFAFFSSPFGRLPSYYRACLIADNSIAVLTLFSSFTSWHQIRNVAARDSFTRSHKYNLMDTNEFNTPENPAIQLRAMVIDDSRVMRNMVMQALEKAELAVFEFTEAGTGSEGLDKFDADLIDIIFVDWNMPEMNGIEFARQIRSMPWAHHVPIVMITSEIGTDKQQNAYDKARISCYVTKPFTVEELQEKVGPVIAELEKKRGKSAPAPAAAAPPPAKQQGGFFTRLMN